ncbi:MAG: DUF998 domain-containing protein [Woeseiaceae bacterium]
MNVVSVVLASTASAYLLSAIVWAARRKPGYSHVKQTISELAEYGSKHAWLVSVGVFLPVGAVLAVVAWQQHSSDNPVALLAISIATGYVTSAIFPCDPGSPMLGSFRQAVHNLGGGIQYVGGALSLLWISETAGPVFRAIGLLIGACAVLLSFESQFRGIIQRLAETCLFSGLIARLLVT